MVMARLHVICGNCGCNDMWKFQIDLEGQDFGDKFEPDVFIRCGNCATVHALTSNAEQEPMHKAKRESV